MSFDLAVFEPGMAADDAAAAEVYAKLCGKPASPTKPGARISKFYAALTALYPELDDSDDSPFASAITQRANGLVFNVSFSRAQEVAHVVETRAKQAGLDSFDPQTGKLLRALDPKALPRPEEAPRLKPKDGLAHFAPGIAPRLLQYGFEPARTKHCWSRTLPNGIIQVISLNCATRSPRMDVSVGHRQALAALSAATGKKESLPTMGLEYLYYAGLIPGRAWDEANSAFAEYEICHADCVGRAIAGFTKDLEMFAIPFFEGHSSLEQMYGFFQRSEPYCSPRPNWSDEESRVVGYACRYFGSDLGLLLGVALSALAEPTRNVST
jgi:hypothetical protein